MYNQSAADAVGLTDCRIMKLLFKVIVYIANTAVLIPSKFHYQNTTRPCCTTC